MSEYKKEPASDADLDVQRAHAPQRRNVKGRVLSQDDRGTSLSASARLKENYCEMLDRERQTSFSLHTPAVTLSLQKRFKQKNIRFKIITDRRRLFQKYLDNYRYRTVTDCNCLGTNYGLLIPIL